MIKTSFSFYFFNNIFVLGPLTQKELENLVDNIDLDQSDIGELSSEDEEQDLTTHFAEDEEVEQIDSSSSDDDLPLSHFLPARKKSWDRTVKLKVHSFPFFNDAADVNRVLEYPIKYLEKYISDDFYEDIALYTNMREVKDKGRSFETTSDEIKMFFGVSILMGIYGLPRIRMFWSREMRVPVISDNISRDRYFGLRSRLKLVEDDKISREERSLDRFWKVRPMLDRVLKGCRQNKRTEAASIDEQMIPFHGKVIMRQFVRGKPEPVGIKNFVMTTPTGIPLDFYLYEGKGSSLESALTPVPEKLDIGGRMVLKLTDTLPAGVSVYTDRYFTSIPLIDALLSRKLTLTGTIMLNRLPKNATFLKDSDLKKSGRGSHDQLVRQDSNLNLVKWFDSKPVHLASSSTGVEPLGTCSRWSKTENKYITINQPAIVNEYNLKMGGVDLLDRVIGKYPMRARTDKWTIRTIYHFFDFSIAASWLEYREHATSLNYAKKDIMDYLEFKLSLGKSLIHSANKSKNEENNIEEEEDELPTPRKQRKVEPVPDKRDRRKGNKHLPTFMNHQQKSRSKCRKPGCGKLTFVKCTSCNIFLCCSVERNCFELFHN